MSESITSRLCELAMERVSIGLFAVDRDYRLLLWNDFMQQRSGLASSKVIGQNLFDCFPSLPQVWLKKKFNSVFLLKNSTFTSWEHRPYLFRFEHDRPITGGVEWMQQDCAFVPLIEDGHVVAVCVTITDVTDIAIAWREKEAAVEALREASVRDPLTGLFNRRYVNERLTEEYRRWQRNGADFSVIMFDIDHFKRTNDTYGHAVGDLAIQSVANAASSQLREVDVLGRFGGEEFIVLLPQCSLENAYHVGERIREKVAQQVVPLSSGHLVITISVGVASAEASQDVADMLVKNADAALYKAKAGGRNQVALHKTGQGEALLQNSTTHPLGAVVR
ncbi:diguanylate cyclase [Crenobacter sp. SG2303]|uniref:diguanylate cyclase n=1 Tax=Crenobacter oryzisoli TaxID=3056844 RepID=A0ABT7XSA1_9NEIS|nr:diguanylate cyclase [Crenobacter sp. SG2303]MDN0076419.1 diguanylate cyclase [Crenobacter sp. SG2303]